MNFTRPEDAQGTIFARELQMILSTHHLQLHHLHSLAIGNREIQRLRRSLSSPGLSHFPVFTHLELDRLITAMKLTPPEQRRLHAALIATDVERILAGRMTPDGAFLAANQVFETCLEALNRQQQRGSEEREECAECEANLPVNFLSFSQERTGTIDIYEPSGISARVGDNTVSESMNMSDNDSESDSEEYDERDEPCESLDFLQLAEISFSNACHMMASQPNQPNQIDSDDIPLEQILHLKANLLRQNQKMQLSGWLQTISSGDSGAPPYSHFA